jgi:hypothetical protein
MMDRDSRASWTPIPFGQGAGVIVDSLRGELEIAFTMPCRHGGRDGVDDDEVRRTVLCGQARERGHDASPGRFLAP